MSILKITKRRYILIPLIVVVSFLLVHFVQAVTSTPPSPGSDGDPLVTQGYVDNEIKSLSTQINSLSSKINDLTESRDSLLKKVDDLTSTVAKQEKKIKKFNTTLTSLNNEIAAMDNTLKSIDIKAGQTLLTGTGTEVILRKGNAKIVSGISGGMFDIATGKEYLNDKSVSKNHLLLSPLNDGRGIKATTDSWVLIRGTYSIE